MAEIRELLETYRAAVRAKDVDAFCALYDEDVVLFDMWGEWSYRGLPAWRRNVEQWFGSLGDELVGVDFDELEVRGPVAHMLVRYSGLSAEGEELRALWSRMTWVVVDGLVIHEHSSSPASFETGKVMLSRT